MLIPSALLSALNRSTHEPTLVVGIGSAHGSDQVGWLISDLLAEMQLPAIVVRKAQVPLDILDWLEDYAQVHVLDALICESNTIGFRQWTWSGREGLQCQDRSGDVDGWNNIECNRRTTHGYDLISVLHLASTLDKIDGLVTIWGIEVSP